MVYYPKRTETEKRRNCDNNERSNRYTRIQNKSLRQCGHPEERRMSGFILIGWYSEGRVEHPSQRWKMVYREELRAWLMMRGEQ